MNIESIGRETKFVDNSNRNLRGSFHVRRPEVP